MKKGFTVFFVLLGLLASLTFTARGAEAAHSVEDVPEGKRVVFDALPQNAAELSPCHTPEETAALALTALVRFSENQAEGIAMLNVLRGPRPLSAHEIQLLKDQLLGGRSYVARSHFEGATPDNDYTPSRPYAVLVTENIYSYTTENYARLFLHSGGADSPRPITLRLKPSTGEWFLWDHVGLLPGIRIPASKDAWR